MIKINYKKIHLIVINIRSYKMNKKLKNLIKNFKIIKITQYKLKKENKRNKFLCSCYAVKSLIGLKVHKMSKKIFQKFFIKIK